MGKRLAGLFAAVALALPGVSAVLAHPAGAASAPRLTVGDVRVDEGDAGKIVVKVPVDLDVPATAKITVAYRISGGSATPLVDFAASKKGPKTGTKPINVKKLDTSVSVTVYGDATVEPDETIYVDVTAASGAQITRSRGTVTIANDDGVGGAGGHATQAAHRANAGVAIVVPRVSIGTPVVVEGNSGRRDALVPVTLSFPAQVTTTVKFETEGTDDLVDDGNCATGDDPTVARVTTTVTFKPGQQSMTVKVPVLGNVSDDPTREALTEIVVTGGGATVDQASADVVVLDDDPAPHAPVQPPVGITRASEPVDGSFPTFPLKVAKTSTGCGYPDSHEQRISADGRYVAFASNAHNLVSGDTNGYDDVFEKDLWTGAVKRISVAVDGTQADRFSLPLGISADGHDVLFQSWADNLVPGDDNQIVDMFLYDGAAGTLERIADLHTLHQGSMYGSMSADGRYVAFGSTAPLTGGCACTSVFVLDRATSTITLASTGAAGQLASASFATISADGRHVAFVGQAGLVTGVVYVKDLDTGTLAIASVNNAGQVLQGNWDRTYYHGTSPWFPSISADGRIVAFSGQLCNSGVPSTICGDGPLVRESQVYVRDRSAGTTDVASIMSDGQPMLLGANAQSISSDGRYVVFDTSSMQTTPECATSGSTAGAGHVYERDRVTGTTVRVDVMPTEPCPSSHIELYGTQSVSDDGRMVAFSSLVGLAEPVSATNPEGVYVNRLR